MFEYQAQPRDEKAEKVHGAMSWSPLVILGTMAVLALVLGIWASMGLGSVGDRLDATENSVRGGLVLLAQTPFRDARAELGRSVRTWERQLSQLQQIAARGDMSDQVEAQDARMEGVLSNLQRLVRLGREWRRRLQEAPRIGGEDAWREIQGDVVDERLLWPGFVVPDPYQLSWHDLRRNFWHGAWIGASWPFHALRGAASIAPSGYGFWRRILFPYGKRLAIGPVHLLGFGLTSTLIGYGLCWFGLRFHRAWASYLGLAWFAYMMVFGAGMVGLRLGVLT